MMPFAKPRNYDALITLGQLHNIDIDIFELAREWIEDSHWIRCNRWIGREWDCGYAELEDDIDIDTIFKDLAIEVMFVKAEGKREYQKWIKNMKRRPDKGISRRILKAYYLMGNPE